MANFDAMFGLPRPLGGAKACSCITLMQLQEAVITVTADVVPVLPGAAETVTELTLSAEAAGKPLKETVCLATQPDSAMLLFQLCCSPSDAFISNIFRPFVQRICDLLGRPLVQLVKPS